MPWRPRKPLLLAGAALDQLFVAATFKSPRAVRRALDQVTVEKLDRLGELYRAADTEGRLFPEVDTPWPSTTPVRDLEGGQVVDLAWPSAWKPLHPDYGRILDAVPQTRTAHARWLKHRTPAPAIITIHGWGAGRFGLEERAFRAEWLYRRGLDVLLFTLPFHARRGAGGLAMPAFPSTNPVRTNEGLAQAIGDLRGLVQLLKDRGAPSVGIMGMSLGGFTTSLAATVIPDLAYAIPMIPVASLAGLMWHNGDGTEARRDAERQGLTKDRFVDAFAATAPTERAPKVDPDRVLVIAGKRDRVIPGEHAERLKGHFDAREVVLFPGSHLMQTGRDVAFGAVLDLLEELKVVPRG